MSQKGSERAFRVRTKGIFFVCHFCDVFDFCDTFDFKFSPIFEGLKVREGQKMAICDTFLTHCDTRVSHLEALIYKGWRVVCDVFLIFI